MIEESTWVSAGVPIPPSFDGTKKSFTVPPPDGLEGVSSIGVLPCPQSHYPRSACLTVKARGEGSGSSVQNQDQISTPYPLSAPFGQACDANQLVGC